MTQRTDLQPTEGQRTETFGSEAGVSHAGSRTKRAIRIAVALPVDLRDQFGGRHDARTQFVMLRGAVLTASSNLRVGHKLTLRNLKSGRGAECHVTSIEPGPNGIQHIEIEFTAPQNDFWPVQFPAEEIKASDLHRPADSAHINAKVTGLSSHGTSEVHNDDIVVLADSVASSLAGRSPERVAARAGNVDSVAQFRAANRAAHRHERRMKAVYSLLSIAALAGAAMGGRYWLNHRQDALSLSPAPMLKSVAQKIIQVLPEKKPSAVPTAEGASGSTDQSTPNQVVGSSVPNATAVLDSPAAAGADSIPTPNAASDAQVSVRHGSSMSSKRRNADDSGEEPVALPLRVDAAVQSKPEVLKDVVAEVPVKTAVLAPQAPKRAVPAKLIHTASAQYPAMARQLHVEGEVVLDVNVDVSGAVSNVKVLSGPPLLRSAAVDAVSRWRYQPATLGEKPVTSTETVKIDFHWR